jgi:sugar lactone lactonase YvrE
MKVFRLMGLPLFLSFQLALCGCIKTHVGPSLPVKGVPAITQVIDSPGALAVDGAGGFFVSSRTQNRIYRVAANGSMSITAGVDPGGSSGDGGAATAAQLNGPIGVAVDSAQNLYIADSENNRIRKITPAGIISTVAGNGISGYNGDGGLATAAQLNKPIGVAVDSKGDLYIADSQNYRIRKVSTAGIISTVAGNGISGYSGDGGLATEAQLRDPRVGPGLIGGSIGVAVDSAGNIYIADAGNQHIRKVTPAGIISTVELKHILPQGVAVASAANVSTVELRLILPQGVAVDSADNLYIADTIDSRILKVTPAGDTSIVAGIAGGMFINTGGYSGDGGRATSAQLSGPTGMAVDSAGTIYIADAGNHRIRKVTPAGIISTVVGNRNSGYSRGGGLATTAQLNPSHGIITTYVGPSLPVNGTKAITQAIDYPGAVAADGAGGFYVSSPYQNRIYKVASDGSISLKAGVGANGYSGDGGSATAAQLNGPLGVAVDSAGNLYIADIYNNRIRKVTPAGIISTVAGNGISANSGDGGLATAAQLNSPTNVAIDSAGNLYIADSDRIRKVTPSGIISTKVMNVGVRLSFILPKAMGIAVDSTGNLYLVDSARIRKVTPAGISSTVAGNGLGGYSGDGGLATVAQLNSARAVAVDSAGNLYIADAGNQRIRKVTTAGIISTVAGAGNETRSFRELGGGSGDGGLATAAQLYNPSSVAVDSAGNIYIADSLNHRIRKVTPAGIISTVAGNGTSGFSGDGGLAIAAQLNSPDNVAIDSKRNLYIADTVNNRIRKVTRAGIISAVAGKEIGGYSGDGGRATAAQLNKPTGVAVDSKGNLYIADSQNYRIRKVTAAGIISTVAGNGTRGYSGDGGLATEAQLNSPRGVVVDSKGDLYIADSQNCRIHKVTAAGIITTVAGNGTRGYSGDGGAATAAQLYNPRGVVVDFRGNIYIADSSNHRIRKVTPAGIISTVAGNGTRSDSGNGGLATAAQLNSPEGVAVDSAGNLYIADTGNQRIRKVTPAGIISTVAGNGTLGYSGDQARATAAQLNLPDSVAIDSAGNLYIADTVNNRIRKVTK